MNVCMYQDSSDEKLAYIIKITALEMSLVLSRHVKVMDGPIADYTG